ncbi:Tetracenomycin polyketide synthesis O-methyltransferase TcmP [Escovopsis weberi]|uniref:Tetracenomycin polyketide synthesis O-methyltransferase TcmP n=1 Tax=Escovopsis weberi TaxID=150374 RepID=A0A0M9VRL5_ESCWE|nr:Tetracenomycin polyketide synthesis O-methyltransferase TcmP [Escovopsis weberi]
MQFDTGETQGQRNTHRAPVSPDEVSSMGPVSQTALLTLSGRAHDAVSKRPILGDRWAVDMLHRIPSLGSPMVLNRFFYPGIALRSLLYDQWTTEFLHRNPDATVLHLACGLDTRALRVSPLGPGVRWIDVDVPEVVALRRRLLSSEPASGGEYHLLAASVLDLALLQGIPDDRPTLIVAEGLLLYLSREGVLDLMQRLAARFPSGQIVCDFCSGAFTWFRHLPLAMFRVIDLFGFTANDGNELAAASPRLLLTDNLAISDIPNQELCPWYLRVLSKLTSWIPVLRTMYSVCRLEIREPEDD